MLVCKALLKANAHEIYRFFSCWYFVKYIGSLKQMTLGNQREMWLNLGNAFHTSIQVPECWYVKRYSKPMHMKFIGF